MCARPNDRGVVTKSRWSGLIVLCDNKLNGDLRGFSGFRAGYFFVMPVRIAYVWTVRASEATPRLRLARARIGRLTAKLLLKHLRNNPWRGFLRGNLLRVGMLHICFVMFVFHRFSSGSFDVEQTTEEPLLILEWVTLFRRATEDTQYRATPRRLERAALIIGWLKLMLLVTCSGTRPTGVSR